MLKFYVDYLMARFGSKKGQGMVEYALIIGLVAVLLIAGLTTMRTQIGDVFTNITTALKLPTQ